MLEVDHLRFRYPGADQMLEFTCAVAAGQCLAVTGPSGCGKSTLLNLIAGFLTAQSGTLDWNGVDLKPLAPWDRPITSVFQDHNLFDHLTVRANLALGLHPGGRLTASDRQQLERVLEEVGLGPLIDRYPTALSGGQRQRVAIARALLRRSPLLLLDEPFSGLDSETRQVLRNRLKQHKAQHIALVMVSHDADDVTDLADRSLTLTP